MRIVVTMAVLCLACLRMFAEEAEGSSELSDAEMSEYIATKLSGFRHGFRPLCAGLLTSCNNDTNRLRRIAQETYMRYPDERARHMALTIIDEYPDASQVPFLDSCVTNLRHGTMAILALNGVEGFSSNSVLRTDRHLSATTQAARRGDMRASSDRLFALDRLVFAATRPSVGPAMRKYTEDYLFAFASNNCYEVCEADRGLIQLDASYKDSKRRLALLRFARLAVSAPFALDYVTNAINELVAYPEANLSE